LEPSSENIQPADANRDLTPSSPPPSGPTEPPADAAEQEQPSFRLWLFRNLVAMVFMTALVTFITVNYGKGDLAKWVMVGLGLGVVILVHELGHFLVAKWCDVYVETFSIGFGPAFPGCQYKKGETTYKIAMFPLGGYVKMLGENPEEDPDGEDNPRSFKNKSVPQRMAIISAGVIMNVILGCLAFMFVYRVHGDEQVVGVIGLTDPGSPAWVDGTQSGDIIKRIGNFENPSFDELKQKVPLSAKEKLPFIFGPPGGPWTETTIEPRRNPDEDMPVIGVAPPSALQVLPESKRGDRESPAFANTAAARASPPFQFGDEIIATTDPDNPSQLKELPPNAHNPESKLRDYFEFQKRLQRLAGHTVTVQVLRKDASGHPQKADIKVPPSYYYTLGLRMKMGRVFAVRPLKDGSPNPVQYMNQVVAGEKVSGDVIKKVEVDESDGRKTRWVSDRADDVPDGVVEKDLDPIRLPQELKSWAKGVSGDPKVRLTVGRTIDKDGGRSTVVELSWDRRFAHAVEVPINLDSPISIPELGIAYQVETTIDDVLRDSPAGKAKISRLPADAPVPGPWYASTWAIVLGAAVLLLAVVTLRFREHSIGIGLGLAATLVAAVSLYQLVRPEPPARVQKISEPFELKKGDVITEVRFYQRHKDGSVEPARDAIPLKEHQWARVAGRLQEVGVEAKQISLKVERGNSTTFDEVLIVAEEDKDSPRPDLGLFFVPYDTHFKKADSLFEAIQMGFKRTSDFIVMIYGVLKSLVNRDISVKSIGGPIMIFKTGFDILDYDIYKFVFFLGMISVNLAVINFLPIPVLDGGHFVFLLYEGIFRKPAPEKVRVAMTYVGLLLLVSLMLFVIVLDLKRYVF
jgi:regulator of sigma E protease